MENRSFSLCHPIRMFVLGEEMDLGEERENRFSSDCKDMVQELLFFGDGLNGQQPKE